jgi:hypothetical protein
VELRRFRPASQRREERGEAKEFGGPTGALKGTNKGSWLGGPDEGIRLSTSAVIAAMTEGRSKLAAGRGTLCSFSKKRLQIRGQGFPIGIGEIHEAEGLHPTLRCPHGK